MLTERKRVAPRPSRRGLLTGIAATAGAAFLAGCAALPSLEGRVASSVITDTADTQLGTAIKLNLTEDPNYYIQYYFDTNKGALYRQHSGQATRRRADQDQMRMSRRHRTKCPCIELPDELDDRVAVAPQVHHVGQVGDHRRHAGAL